MDPLNFRLREYLQIPQINQQELQIRFPSRKIVLFHDLIVDYTDFEHPGYNRIIDQFQGNQIAKPYVNENHSFNADLIICHKTVGRIRHSDLSENGRSFYETIRNSEKTKKHQAVLEKINFDNPLMEECEKLNAEELTILTEIPKIFTNPEKVKFKATKLEALFFQQNFWRNNVFFFLYISFAFAWIFKHFNLSEIKQDIVFLIFGLVSWTVVEYVFHRFPLHQRIKSFNDFRGHLIHHSFPNLQNKIAVSIIQLTWKLSLIAFGLSYLISPLQVALLVLGFLLTITLYEWMHYCCHFAPETNIRWFKYMRIHHLKHHYRDPTRYFGVTVPFWDQLFGTGIDPKLKK